MITEEMKHTKHYRMYAEVFGLDVPLTQLQPTESTQGTHMTPSAPRSPTLKKDTADSSALKRSTVIHFCLPKRRSTRLTPPVLVPTIKKADEMILQDTLQVSLAEHKSQEEQEARENVKLVNKHLAFEEIEMFEPRSDKESPEVEKTNDEEVEVTNVVTPVNVNEEEDEITDEVYKFKAKDEGKLAVLGETKDKEEMMERMIAKAILQERWVNKLKISLHIFKKLLINQIPSNVDAPSSVRPRDQNDPHDDAYPEGENSAKRQKTSEYEAYVSGESSYGQVNKEERDVDEILPRSKLVYTRYYGRRDEHQYHIDQMKDHTSRSKLFGKVERKFMFSTSMKRPHLSFKAVQSDPEASQTLFFDKSRPFATIYLKKGVQDLRKSYCHFTSFQ
ncbi:hypothetical protein Tco_1055338 [Tanacetum coccineum]|uniref:Uncharacterized protein n=1 Tax=Tanacetum coccineum TaxID=301880 RepID=A0ABQ5H0J6_9ASTR